LRLLHLHATTRGRTSTTCSRPRRCLASTLATIHNEWFTVKLVDDIRDSIEQGRFVELRTEWLDRYQRG